jgi:hypothetical protein
VAVVEVGCFDICPKDAAIALRAAEPGRWLVVPAGMRPADVLAALGIAAPTEPEKP